VPAQLNQPRLPYAGDIYTKSYPPHGQWAGR